MIRTHRIMIKVLAAIQQQEIYTQVHNTIHNIFKKAITAKSKRRKIEMSEFKWYFFELFNTDLGKLTKKYFEKTKKQYPHVDYNFNFRIDNELKFLKGAFDIFLSTNNLRTRIGLYCSIRVKFDINEKSFSDFVKKYKDNGYNDYLHNVANTITHEIVHMIQFLRTDFSKMSATEIIEFVKKNDKVKKVSEDNTIQQQYLGKVIELDAYAASAANDLIYETQGNLFDAKTQLALYLKNPKALKEGTALYNYYKQIRNKDGNRAWNYFLKKVYGYILQHKARIK